MKATQSYKAGELKMRKVAMPAVSPFGVLVL